MTRLTLASFTLCAVMMALALSCADARVVERSPSTIALPFVRRMNTTGFKNLLQIDQARAKALKARAKGSRSSAPFLMAPSDELPAVDEVVDYVASVGVGNPPTECKCFDDGCSGYLVDRLDC